MAAEDFKGREVRLLWLIALAAGTLCCRLPVEGLASAMNNMLLNMAMLVLLAAGTLLFLRLRHGKVFPKDYMGSGDVVFLLALTPMFGLREYLLFLITSLIVSLVWWSVVRAVRKKNLTIPFVGTAGTVLSLYLIISVL